MIYLDHAAATPVSDEVMAAMLPFFTEQFYNPSATYLPARAVRRALDDARSRVALALGVRPSEIIFTAGGTEANNLAIAGVLRKNPNCSVTVSGIEHESVLAPAQQFNCSVALVSEQGRVGVDDIRAKITDETVLLSVMYANNEVGTIQPIKQITRVAADIRADRAKRGVMRPLYVHTDAAQAGNHLSLNVSSLGVDMMTINGGKLYGPKQSGVLYVASHVQLEPLVYGGGQERGLRSGTENVAAAVGLATALECAQHMRNAETERLSMLQQYAFQQIFEKLPSATVNGSIKQRLPNNIHLTLPGTDNERVLVQLEKSGIIAAAGSACSASSEEPSHVLRAMGISDADAQSSLRFTMGRSTTQDDIDVLLRALREITADSTK